MHPIGGLGLAQSAWQAVHGVQRMGLLGDEDEEQLVGHLCQNALALPLWRWRTLPSQVLAGGESPA